MKYLIEDGGARVNVEDRWGGTPLSDAIKHDHHELADYLRDHGATMKEVSIATDMCDAGFRGDIKRVRTLLKNKADVNTADYDGRTVKQFIEIPLRFTFVRHCI